MTAVKPQLKRIYQTLLFVASVRLQDGFSRKNEIVVGHHLSGACRASTQDGTRELPAAQLLLMLDDVDMDNCRELRQFRMGFFVTAVLTLPTIFALSGNLGGNLGINLWIPTIWGAFSVGSSILLTQYGESILSGFIVSLGIVILYKFDFFHYIIALISGKRVPYPSRLLRRKLHKVYKTMIYPIMTRWLGREVTLHPDQILTWLKTNCPTVTMAESRSVEKTEDFRLKFKKCSILFSYKIQGRNLLKVKNMKAENGIADIDHLIPAEILRLRSSHFHTYWKSKAERESFLQRCLYPTKGGDINLENHLSPSMSDAGSRDKRKEKKNNIWISANKKRIDFRGPNYFNSCFRIGGDNSKPMKVDGPAQQADLEYDQHFWI